MSTRLRWRNASQPSWPGEPLPLSERERGWLRDWARGDAAERSWELLRRQAGASALDALEPLAERLLEAGVWRLQQRFHQGRWWPQRIAWEDLTRLQAELGLRSVADRDAEAQALAERAAGLARDPRFATAVAAWAALRADLRLGRLPLLESLRDWLDQQRQGHEREFSLFARPDSKAVTTSEWAWLRECFDLSDCGIQGFAPVLWLAAEGQVQSAAEFPLHAAQFLAWPVADVLRWTAWKPAPQRYWLIENRAPFEKLAAQRQPGDCLIWTAGRPGRRWLDALRQLLRLAPAPACISADADPAGIEIALEVSQPWQEAALPWQPVAMGAHELECAKRQPLSDFDHQLLRQQLEQADRLGLTLHRLAQRMAELNGKAEQEAWL